MHVRVAIVGTGFSGLGAAIRLQEAGQRDFLLFERASDIGGTWRDNTYPGCACDVESDLYSFSFAQNPSWSRSFSSQPEIWAYLKGVVDRYQLRPQIRFNHEMLHARWDAQQRRWSIETSGGSYTADILISGMGALSEPIVPALEGLERFQGEQFHSARWNHEHALEGKRVAVIGTGASAVQFVPVVQKKAQKLTLFQRTPAWVIPRLDTATSKLRQKLFALVPALQTLVRTGIYARRELFVVAFRNPRVMWLVQQLAAAHLRYAVRDPALRAKLLPSFRLGCKRILISDDYLPALTQANVEVVTSGIREVREHSIIGSDGVEHPVDTLIFGTGFHVTDMPFADRITGRDGRTLNEHWQGSPEAHLGTTVAGFPNLFLLLGPNTGLGHTSVVYMVESQLQLMMQALAYMDARGVRTLEPTREAQRGFIDGLQAMMQGTVWTSGNCASWYIDITGKNSTLWPSFTFSFRQRMEFKPAEYQLETANERDATKQTTRGRKRTPAKPLLN